MELKHIKTKTEEYYKDEQGRMQGEYKWFYKNRNLYAHCFYKDDKRNGECKEFYESGNLSVQSFWKKGKRNGKYKRFYENGNLSVQCFCKDDKFNGKHKWFSENGKLIETKYYQNGINITSKVEKLRKWN